MTYIEKVMQMVKFDKEMLTEEQAKKLRRVFEIAIVHNCCPGDFFLGSITLKACRKECWDCWHPQEEEQ